MKRQAVLLLLLALGGCATAPTSITEPAAPGSRYTIERSPELVAELRAQPAPESPAVEDGHNREGDRRRLAAQGFVAIGTGYFPGNAAEAREAAVAQGIVVGADRLLLYPPEQAEAESSANYFVRFQLPFGATFRDLRGNERAALGGKSGVVLGSIVGGTPASRANLLTGDIVLAFDGEPVADRGAFQRQLRSRAGHAVRLTLLRNGTTLTRSIRLGVVAGDSP